jgi:hypothetical protein
MATAICRNMLRDLRSERFRRDKALRRVFDLTH